MRKTLFIEAHANQVHHWHPVIWAEVTLSAETGLVPELLRRRKYLQESQLLTSFTRVTDLIWKGRFPGVSSAKDQKGLSASIGDLEETGFLSSEHDFSFERKLNWLGKVSTLTTASVRIEDLLLSLDPGCPLAIGDRIFPAGNKVIVPRDPNDRDRFVDTLFAYEELRVDELLKAN